MVKNMKNKHLMLYPEKYHRTIESMDLDDDVIEVNIVDEPESLGYPGIARLNMYCPLWERSLDRKEMNQVILGLVNSEYQLHSFMEFTEDRKPVDKLIIFIQKKKTNL